MPENAKFNNKVDIFALGCILYEVSTGVKLFTSDFAIHDYSSLPHRPIHFPVPCISPYPTPKNLKTTVDDLLDLLFAMLDLEPLSRPRAEHLAFIWVTAILQSEPNYCPRSNPYLTSIGEVERLSEKLEQFGEDWDSIGREIPSRTVQQVQSSWDLSYYYRSVNASPRGMHFRNAIQLKVLCRYGQPNKCCRLTV